MSLEAQCLQEQIDQSETKTTQHFERIKLHMEQNVAMIEKVLTDATEELHQICFMHQDEDTQVKCIKCLKPEYFYFMV